MCAEGLFKVVVSAGFGMPNFHYRQMPGQEFCGSSATTTQFFCQIGYLMFSSSDQISGR